MDVLHHLAQAAAVILLIELIVFVLIFAGVAGGLAFGLRWVRGKEEWAFGMTNKYADLGLKYLHIGTDYAAKPFILGAALGSRGQGTVRAVREQVRRYRSESAAPPPVEVAARPVAPPPQPVEEEAPVPLV